MRVDNSHHVIAAARQRSQSTHRRAVTALCRMDTTGMPITVDALAREAGVSRSWLYTQPDLRSEIERLRQPHRSTSRRRVPDRQRASDTSLQCRLDLAAERVKQLETDNQRLRRALAEALGARRSTNSREPVATRRGNEFHQSPTRAEHPRPRHHPQHTTAGHSPNPPASSR